MESNRKRLNKQQTQLRRVMMSFDQHDEAIRLFLRQHAMLHSAKLVTSATEGRAQNQLWSFEDEILNDMTEEGMRRFPRNCEHSVAWCGSPQVLHRESWLGRMKVTVCDTGNEMDEEELANLSATIDIQALRAYRVAVGRRTRVIAQGLKPEELKHKVGPIRVQQVMDEGAVIEAARGIVDYWSKRDIAGLLLMPATRHNLVHLNEALQLKQRRQ
jgi:hypothetical protein